MAQSFCIPTTGRDMEELQPKVHAALQEKLLHDDQAKVIEIKTTDKARERKNPIEPPFLLVEAEDSLSESLLEMVRRLGEQRSVSTVEIFCLLKDRWGEYGNEHLLSFHHSDASPRDDRRETITVTILGSISVFKAAKSLAGASR